MLLVRPQGLIVARTIIDPCLSGCDGSRRSPARLQSCVALLVARRRAGRARSTRRDRSVVKAVLTTALINLVLVVALYIFAGNSGIFSFGHLAFAAIGAYTGGILTIPPKSAGDVTGKDVLLPNLPWGLGTRTPEAIVATLIAGARGDGRRRRGRAAR